MKPKEITRTLNVIALKGINDSFNYGELRKNRSKSKVVQASPAQVQTCEQLKLF